MLGSSNVIREEVHRQVGESIKSVQKKQQRDYESPNKSSVSNEIYISTEVLLKNNKHKDRKSGKFTFKWLGPYTVLDITKKGLVTLKNKSNKNNKAQLKLFFEIRMVSRNIKISQRTKSIKVMMIVSKILSTTLFRTTNLWTKIQSKTARTARFQMKHQL